MAHGYFKVHRQLFENPMWTDEPFTRGQAWLDLLGKANHKDSYMFVRGIKVDIRRGETCRSEETLAKTWKWSRGKVRRFLTLLESESMITRKQNNKIGVIIICNYGRYQGEETQNTAVVVQQTEQQTDRQQDNKQYPNKNVKNDKKKEYPENSKEFRLSLFLLNNIRMRKPDFKIPNLQKWSQHADYILRVDRRDLEEVKKVIAWSQLDEFWQDNILSTAKLRKQYDKLVLKMNKHAGRTIERSTTLTACPGAIRV